MDKPARPTNPAPECDHPRALQLTNDRGAWVFKGSNGLSNDAAPGDGPTPLPKRLRTIGLVLLAVWVCLSRAFGAEAKAPPVEAAPQNQRKALVIGRGLPQMDAGGGP